MSFPVERRDGIVYRLRLGKIHIDALILFREEGYCSRVSLGFGSLLTMTIRITGILANSSAS